MVGHLMLLKMLHCQRVRQKKKKLRRPSSDDAETRQGSSADVIVKEEDTETQICRVCLKDGIIPIVSSNGREDFSEALRTFGDIEFHVDDDYPKYLCQSCNHLLQGAILFRKTAQQSAERLRHPCKFTIDNDDNDKYSESDSHLIEDHTEDLEIPYDYRDEKVLKQVTDDNDKYSESYNHDTEGLEIPYDYQDEKILKQVTYKCKKCNLGFDTFKDYAEHRISPEHENIRHVCHICKKSYTSLYYKRHMALHKQEKKYMCDVCGKEFIMQGQFTRHRLTHFYELPFKCSLCPYRGRFTESLKMHMRSHTGEKPYQCSACPSRFVSKSNLNKHMWTHQADHNFKCEACGRGFYTKRNLELHFKVDHTGIKDHVCNICGKAFGYRKQMMKHQLKVHKREKLRSGRLPLYLQIESKDQQAD